MPDVAGLYAIHAAAATWRELGLMVSTPGRQAPLYVGKAERSLAQRDGATHFTSGRTGQSTVRRTFAALLREQLDLRPVLRPGGASARRAATHYALDAESEAALTRWMREHLTLVHWEQPATCRDLEAVEERVIAALVPPLNLRSNRASSWRTQILAARKAMQSAAAAQ